MPAKLSIDREQVRILVAQQGVREAAKILGLPYQTVGSWSARFKWLAPPEKQILPPSMIRPANGANSVADLAVQAYRERRLKTKLTHSQMALENAEHLASLPVNQRLADGGQTLTAVVKHAALSDNWDTDNSAKVVVCIQALQTGADTSFLEVEATEVEPEEEDVFQ